MYGVLYENRMIKKLRQRFTILQKEQHLFGLLVVRNTSEKKYAHFYVCFTIEK